jgi:hypothetical protein
MGLEMVMLRDDILTRGGAHVCVADDINSVFSLLEQRAACFKPKKVVELTFRIAIFTIARGV